MRVVHGIRICVLFAVTGGYAAVLEASFWAAILPSQLSQLRLELVFEVVEPRRTGSWIRELGLSP
jgi:hypothetical protein